MEFMTALRGIDDQKPSLFELLSEQQLNALLPPTLRYLLTVATHRYPRYLLRVCNSFDELYALAMLVVERHYLLTRGGGFTEHFYGLKRERALGAEAPRASAAAPAAVREALRLRGRGDLWRNLAVMVLVPYIRRKLDAAHEVEAPRALLGVAYTRLPPNPTLRQRLHHAYRWFVRNVYPSAHAAYCLAVLAFNLGYLFDNSSYHHPLLWLVGARIRRMNAADYQAIDALGKGAAAAATATPETTRATLRSLLNPRVLGPKLLSSLSVLLPTSIFALKFLEWWYASDFAKQLMRKASENLELPPPIVSGVPEEKAAPSSLGTGIPSKEGKEDNNNNNNSGDDVTLVENAPIATPSLLPIFTVPPPAESDLCPICGDEIATPTACQTGLVYCYACIHRWIEGVHPRQEAFMDPATGREGKWESGKGRCAVTGRRVLGGTEGLRRIMV